MKNGLKTTEFWVAIATAILPVINKYMELNLPVETIAGLISYILGRSLVKAFGK